ncbi:Anaphase-promoting complex subunit 4 [Penicillium taxi]|uniref:Anaphase-promoting complex subunit 4 n=1 Tax=Penicillium taxi TaxID=168475 RepID=UPI002544F1C3|nr:Anaphase-promoting complex subunit 4 [Penicillium taxi]KAJ5901657.1 Anaphase-promoting complex subunit 4 [Penicillium taxi]
MEPEVPHLTAVGGKSLPAACKTSTLAYCPSMDLIALSSEKDELSVYRLNGQQLFSGSWKGDPYLGEDEKDGEIRTLAWKPNGRFLAVACGDGSIRIMSAYNGKTVHHYPATKAPSDNEKTSDNKTSPRVTYLGWGVNFTDSEGAQNHLESGHISLDDLLDTSTHPSRASALLKADLPRELALLDIESSLPKLSILPATGAGEDLFSSLASIDSIFHSSTREASDTVDVLFVGFDDGTIHLRIFDRFEIGTICVSDSTGLAESCQILNHASHSLSSTHALLASSAAGNSRAPLDLITLDLRFITKSGRYLSLLASKTTQLQNLLRYIGQVQRSIELEWKNAQELPARFIRSINEDLQEKCQCDFTTAIYHLAATGNCFEPMKEFLVDIIGERGHARWDKAVSVGYEGIRRLTHESLIPALERSQILLSRLVGLSKFQKLSDVLGLDTPKLNAIVETLDCLHLLAHKILIHSNEELHQFAAFSRWLRHEILILNSDPLGQTMEELVGKRDLYEIPTTVKYITGALRKSELRNYIRQLPMLGAPVSQAPATDKWLPDGHDQSFYDQVKLLFAQKRKLLNHGGDTSTVDSPKLNDLTKRLEIQFEKVYAEIAETQRRGILHRSPLTLHEDCDQSILDLKICYEEAEDGGPCSIYAVTRSFASKHLVYIYRTVLDSSNGVSSTRSTSVSAFSLGEGEVRQLQFVDDDTLMILWMDKKGISYLINIPFQPASAQHPSEEPGLQPFTLGYTACGAHHTKSEFRPETETLALEMSMLYDAGMVRHVFPVSGLKSKPIHVSTNGRKCRRAVCVLYGDGFRYDVFDMDGVMPEELLKGPDEEAMKEDLENEDKENN